MSEDVSRLNQAKATLKAKQAAFATATKASYAKATAARKAKIESDDKASKLMQAKVEVEAKTKLLEEAEANQERAVDAARIAGRQMRAKERAVKRSECLLKSAKKAVLQQKATVAKKVKTMCADRKVLRKASKATAAAQAKSLKLEHAKKTADWKAQKAVIASVKAAAKNAIWAKEDLKVEYWKEDEARFLKKKAEGQATQGLNVLKDNMKLIEKLTEDSRKQNAASVKADAHAKEALKLQDLAKLREKTIANKIGKVKSAIVGSRAQEKHLEKVSKGMEAQGIKEMKTMEDRFLNVMSELETGKV